MMIVRVMVRKRWMRASRESSISCDFRSVIVGRDDGKANNVGHERKGKKKKKIGKEEGELTRCTSTGRVRRKAEGKKKKRKES